MEAVASVEAVAAVAAAFWPLLWGLSTPSVFRATRGTGEDGAYVCERHIYICWRSKGLLEGCPL